jgi:hypothetical protein
LTILLLTVAGTVSIALAIPPIPQDLGYHRFADIRKFLGVPNFLDVMSNAGFLVVGVLGVHFVLRRHRMAFSTEAERWSYLTLFCAIIATALGSAYYHLAPDNSRLFWDRLPLAIVAMALTSAIVSERVSAKTGLAVLTVLTMIGAASVLYWRYSELQGQGDLRFYGLAQFLPMLLVPMILLLFPSKYSAASNLVWAFLSYVAAKICEHFDPQIFSLTGGVSGHTCKHVFAALALYFVLRMIQTRQLLEYAYSLRINTRP